MPGRVPEEPCSLYEERGDLLRVRFGRFELDEARRELCCDGVRVKIQPTALRLLIYLVRHRERAVSREELRENVWGAHVSSSAVASAVRRLRAAIGGRGGAEGAVETVRRWGFRFSADVTSVVAPPTDEAARRAPWCGGRADPLLAEAVAVGASSCHAVPGRWGTRGALVPPDAAAAANDPAAEVAGLLRMLRRHADRALRILETDGRRRPGPTPCRTKGGAGGESS